MYHDLYLGGKALVERENVGFDLTKSNLCLSFIEDLTVKDVGLRVAYSHTSNYREDGFTILSMSPPRRQRYYWNITFATGCRRVGRRKWTNCRIRVPAFMRSCRIEEELTWVKTFGKEVEEYVTKVIAKDGTVTRFGGRFPHFIEEEEEKKPKPYNLYGFVDLMENEQVYAKTGFAPHRIPQSEGNHNGWLSEEEEADSDSESTAINQVTASVNANANNGKGNGGNGNNGCTYKSFMSCNPKEYDGKGGAVVLTRWIERMETIIDNSSCADNSGNYQTKFFRDGLETVHIATVPETQHKPGQETEPEHVVEFEPEDGAPISFGNDEEINMDDLSKLVKKTSESFMEWESLQEEHPIRVSSEDKADMRKEPKDT
ncbi:hypothetical protein Tco_1051241 [Tanacetum coccineum]